MHLVVGVSVLKKVCPHNMTKSRVTPPPQPRACAAGSGGGGAAAQGDRHGVPDLDFLEVVVLHVQVDIRPASAPPPWAARSRVRNLEYFLFSDIEKNAENLNQLGRSAHKTLKS